MKRKTTQLKELLLSRDPEFLLEAHSGLSAKIVEEAGFRGIWGSGLSISAALGVRDNNELSWTQVLAIAELMSDNTDIPILLDADTGYGNFNNVRRLVRKLEQRDIAGMCIEDKLFPKTNSFVGNGHPLADTAEFAGKIKAAKDTQLDPDFCVVARTESLVAGRGISEALERAEAYHLAGADAILVHSKQSTADEVFDFMTEWRDVSPIVIVPTTYHRTPTSQFAEAGVSVVIWANHLMRSTITAMQRIAARIRTDKKVTHIEDEIACLAEVFRLQDMMELKKAEEEYLPHPKPVTT